MPRPMAALCWWGAVSGERAALPQRSRADGSSVLTATGLPGPSLPRRYAAQHWRQPRATACGEQCPCPLSGTTTVRYLLCRQVLCTAGCNNLEVGSKQILWPVEACCTRQQSQRGASTRRPWSLQRRPQPFPTAASDQATRSGHGNRCSLPDPVGCAQDYQVPSLNTRELETWRPGF